MGIVGEMVIKKPKEFFAGVLLALPKGIRHIWVFPGYEENELRLKYFPDHGGEKFDHLLSFRSKDNNSSKRTVKTSIQIDNQQFVAFLEPVYILKVEDDP